MKSINFKILGLMLVTAALLSSCGLNRMVRNYDEGVRYTPETNPLENHGGQVAANVQGTIGEGYFHRRAMVEFTPVLVYEDGEKELETVTLRGSRTTAEGQMVNRDQQSTFNLNNVIAYQPEMKASELYIRARLYREGREDRATTLPERKVADGIILTSQRVKKDEDISLAPHGYEKETIVTEKANIYFAYMRHNLNWRLDLNRQDEAREKVENFKNFVNKGWKIHSMEVNAWASPEGEVAFNEELSENRAETGRRYFEGLLEDWKKKREEKKKDEARRIDPDEPKLEAQKSVVVNARGEDFEGFMEKLQASDLPDKQAIANVINSQLKPAESERRIKDMTLIYEEIEKILEPLRRAELIFRAYEPKKTDEEIARLSTDDPSKLDVKELLYAATLTDDKETKLTIYKSAQELHPRDYRGFNNAAYVYLKQGDADAAARNLERANQLAPGNGHVQNNLGVIAAWERDIENAKSLYEAAIGQGVDAQYNIGNLMVLKGDYQAALSSYSGRTCTHNVALAQLMTDNKDGAMNNLNCAPESAAVSYLKAIIGARQNNTSLLYENLRRAVELDSDYAEIAAEDREFIQYFNQGEFQEIVR